VKTAASSTSRATWRTANDSPRCESPTRASTAGYAVVEVMDAIPSDDVADEDIFELLTRVLLTLDDETYDPMLVPSSFYFKLLALDGSGPVVDVCVNCGRDVPLVAFDAEVGARCAPIVDRARRSRPTRCSSYAHHERGLGGGAARGVARRCRGGDGDRARFDRVALRQATARGALDAAALAAVTGPVTWLDDDERHC